MHLLRQFAAPDNQAKIGSMPTGDEYEYHDAELTAAHDYLLPEVCKILDMLDQSKRRIFELGCGNGAAANYLSARGFDVTGIDTSSEGISHARRAYPALNLTQASAYDDLQGRFGRFPIVLSLEVVEHLYYPRRFASAVHDLLEPGGVAIVSTPYHGYWKNLTMALSGRMDAHFTALWDHGHIKFWSRRTLGILLEEAGLQVRDFRRVGRFPALARSMILVAVRRG